MSEEIWKGVAGHEAAYEVSNQGRVRSLDRQIQVSMAMKSGLRVVYTKTRRGKLIAPQLVKVTGYVQLRIGKARFRIHQLVARAFCDGYAEGLVVNHKNGDKLDNRAENLEWVTRSQNSVHAYNVLGVQSPNKGKLGALSACSKAVESIDMKTREVRRYASIRDAEREGYEGSSISKCCHGHIAYHKKKWWRFAERKTLVVVGK